MVLPLLAFAPAQAAWKKYSECEKTDAQKKQYGPLKDASDACKKHQASGDC
jgi:hypothetical protein